MAVITQTALEVHYDAFKASMAALKLQANAVSTFMGSNDTPSNRLLDWYRKMGRVRDEVNSFSSLTGITEYVKTAENNATYEIVTECNNLVTGIEDCINWIDNNFPSNATYILETQISNGTITYRTFSTVQTAPLVTLVDTMSALIE